MEFMTLTMGMEFWTHYRKDVRRWILVHMRTMGLPQRAANHTGTETITAHSASPTPAQIRATLLRDLALHDDIEAEVFLAVLKGLQNGRIPADVDQWRGWLYNTTRYVTWRKATQQALSTGGQTRDGDASLQATGPTANCPEMAAVARETLERVHLLLPRLPADQQEALRGASAGESPEETAQRLGKKAGTVRTWLFRARKTLQEGLADRQAA